MKKILSAIIVVSLSLILFAQPSVSAFTIVKVMLNGEEVQFSPKAGVANGNTLVPFRQLFERLGATVHYDEKTRAITATKDSTTIKLTLNSFDAFINGKPYKLTQAPVSEGNGSAYVNLRFISEGLGYSVHWDQPSLTVTINSISE